MIPQLIGEILTQHAEQLGGRPIPVSNAAKYSTRGAPIAIGVDDRNMRTSHSGANVRHNSRIGNGLVT